MRVLVKAHKRKGRIVKSHGRVKRENRLKRQGYELVEALKFTTKYPVESLQEAIGAVRKRNDRLNTDELKDADKSRYKDKKLAGVILSGSRDRKTKTGSTFPSWKKNRANYKYFNK